MLFGFTSGAVPQIFNVVVFLFVGYYFKDIYDEFQRPGPR